MSQNGESYLEIIELGLLSMESFKDHLYVIEVKKTFFTNEKFCMNESGPKRKQPYYRLFPTINMIIIFQEHIEFYCF